MKGSFVRFLPRHSNSGCRVCHLAEAAHGIQGVDAKSIVVVRFRRRPAATQAFNECGRLPLKIPCRRDRWAVGRRWIPDLRRDPLGATKLHRFPDGHRTVWMRQVRSSGVIRRCGAKGYDPEGGSD